jgi:hypothetical protein
MVRWLTRKSEKRLSNRADENSKNAKLPFKTTNDWREWKIFKAAG